MLRLGAAPARASTELLDMLAMLAAQPAEGNPPPFLQGDEQRTRGIPRRARSGQARARRMSSRSSWTRTWASVARLPRAPGHDQQGLAALHRRRQEAVQGRRICTSCRARNTSRPMRCCRATSARWPRSTRSNSTRCCTTPTTRTTSTCSRWSFPRPCIGLAVETKKKGDEQRLFEVLHKLELGGPVLSDGTPSCHATRR